MDWEQVPRFGEPPTGAPARVRPSVYALVADGDGRLLVVRTPRGLFLPGGGLEAGEAAHDAVSREVREECGLEVRIGRWSLRAVDFVYSAAEDAHFEKRSTFLEAHPVRTDASPSEPDHEAIWMGAQDAEGRMAHPSHRWAVARWRQRGPRA